MKRAINELKAGKTNTADVTEENSGQSSIRVMTYNIHSCVNTDGLVRPEQVAGVIDELRPHLVALQEVDSGIPRTHYQDQPKILGRLLGMDYRFFPVVKNGDQKYGLAIMSRYPIQQARTNWLPSLYPKLKLNFQKRGVIQATIKTPVGPVHFFNTHLSLYRLERRVQLKALLAKDGLKAVPEAEPLVFCGDLNSGPLSPVYRQLSRFMSDAQKNSLLFEGVLPTFPSRRPLFRIDHIFTSQHFRILKTIVPVNDDTRLASDHLPLCTDLTIHK